MELVERGERTDDAEWHVLKPYGEERQLSPSSWTRLENGEPGRAWYNLMFAKFTGMRIAESWVCIKDFDSYSVICQRSKNNIYKG